MSNEAKIEVALDFTVSCNACGAELNVGTAEQAWDAVLRIEADPCEACMEESKDAGREEVAEEAAE